MSMLDFLDKMAQLVYLVPKQKVDKGLNLLSLLCSSAIQHKQVQIDISVQLFTYCEREKITHVCSHFPKEDDYPEVGSCIV